MLLIEAVGTAVNVAISAIWIPGRFGMAEMGIEGAGWGMVIGSSVSAVLALALFFRKPYREGFGTLSGFALSPMLFGRLMRYGGPAGMQIFLDVFVFNLFTQLVGSLGEAEMGATTLAVRFNMVAFLPMLGLGQSVSILVGRRLGEDQPEIAQTTVYTGLKWSFGYMCVIAAAYLLIPHLLVRAFESDKDPEKVSQRWRPSCRHFWPTSRSTRSPIVPTLPSPSHCAVLGIRVSSLRSPFCWLGR